NGLTAACAAYQQQHPKADEDVEQVNAGKDEVIHKEIIRHRIDADDYFTAPFKAFIGDKKQPAENPRRKIAAGGMTVNAATFFNTFGDEPGAGEEQKSVENAHPHIEGRPGLGKNLGLLAVVPQGDD